MEPAFSFQPDYLRQGTLAESCQLAVKQLRVMRSIVKSYRSGVPNGEIEEAYMTPYERGRLQRTADKFADQLYAIMKHHQHHRIAFFFLAYVEGLGLKRRMYGVKRSIEWSFIWQNQQIISNNDEMSGEFMAYNVGLVANMLDIPLADVPGRIMLMKLGLPIQ